MLDSCPEEGIHLKSYHILKIGYLNKTLLFGFNMVVLNFHNSLGKIPYDLLFSEVSTLKFKLRQHNCGTVKPLTNRMSLPFREPEQNVIIT